MSEKKHMISIQIDDNLSSRILKEMKKLNLTRSTFIRILLETYFESIYEE